MIPLALLDDDLSFKQKANLAKVILTFKMPISTWYNTINKSKIDLKDKTKMGNKISNILFPLLCWLMNFHILCLIELD